MMELLVTSSRPSEMLWGKILGLGALGLTQILIWAGIGLAFLLAQGNVDIGTTFANLQITPGMLVLLLAYFLLGYLMFGALMAGLGISVNAEQEGRQLAGVVSIIAILPFVLSVFFLDDPNAPLAVVGSLFPLTAPLSMILRLSFGTVPSWQIALSLAILALSGAGSVWLAARLFRLGMLNYGKRLGLRGIVEIAFGGRRVISSGMTATEAKS
jgi:ABC-2 type transport system permease protein